MDDPIARMTGAGADEEADGKEQSTARRIQSEWRHVILLYGVRASYDNRLPETMPRKESRAAGRVPNMLICQLCSKAFVTPA
jgi:hypothetical protein